jgi:hypothetical protein
MMVRAMVAPLCRGVAPAISGHFYKFWWMKVIYSQLSSLNTAYDLDIFGSSVDFIEQRKSVPVDESYPAFSIG